MKKPNTIERDLDRIRLKHYEQTKHMSSAEYVAHVNKSAEDFIKKSGYKIIVDANNHWKLSKA